MRAALLPLATGLLTVLAGAPRAAAHEVLHDVAAGRAVAVRAYESDGDPLAGAEYQVFSPADPRVPWQTGRTDRAGWLAFVPDSPGGWRVRVLEAGGHGLDTVVDASAPGPAAAGAAGGAMGGALLVMRPAIGVAVVALVFGALVWMARRRRSSP